MPGRTASRVPGASQGGPSTPAGTTEKGRARCHNPRQTHADRRHRPFNRDLTLECIRRYYLGEPNPPGPLGPALARYPEFFGLFGDFAGFVDFFMLQDLVEEATSTVKFFTPFEDFTTSPLPATLDAYRRYRDRSIDFIEARNHRIVAYESQRLCVQAHWSGTLRTQPVDPFLRVTVTPQAGVTQNPSRLADHTQPSGTGEPWNSPIA